MKQFKHLGPGDYLYYTSPTTMGVKETLIEKAVDSKKHKGLRVFNVLQNLEDVHDGMTEQKMIEAREYAGANVNQMIYLRSEESFMMIMGKNQAMPIVIATERQALEEWMRKTK